jgi:F420-non-reducing hydrogenase large subunit
MGRQIIIDPITRLEGHGKITVHLDEKGDVDRAFFQVPELRGFEAFCVGRQAEDMPQITSRICGVCPTAHHMAATKALDDLFKVEPTPAAIAIRKLFYNLFMFEDHLIHFYYLGGPDFIVGPNADPAKRNILGVVDVVGVETAKKVISIRQRARELMGVLGGKPIHPVLGLPGGVAKTVSQETKAALQLFASEALEFAKFTMEIFSKIVLGNGEHLEAILSEAYQEETCYMGLVDEQKRVDFYGHMMRVVDSRGEEIELVSPADYAAVFAEHVESWSYIKFPYLRKRGWKGFTGGAESSLVRVAPLGRLNASRGMKTPHAQQEYERLYATLGGKPSHHTLAWNWARLVEVMQAAELIAEYAACEELTDPRVRNMDLNTPREGIGVIEAPRGTLIHHYMSDANGIITKVNLMVATLFNSAPICMSVEKAAKAVIKGNRVANGALNKIEMAFRAYDPCLSCATHFLPGKMPLVLTMVGPDGREVGKVFRTPNGKEERI